MSGDRLHRRPGPAGRVHAGPARRRRGARRAAGRLAAPGAARRSPATGPGPETRPVALGLQPGQALGACSTSASPAGRERSAASPPAPTCCCGRAARRELPFDLRRAGGPQPRAWSSWPSRPFGLDGPKAGLGEQRPHRLRRRLRQLALTGDRDRPPLRWGSPQAYLHGAADMAVGRAGGARGAPALGPRAAGRRLGPGLLPAGLVRLLAQRGVEAPPMRRSGDGLDFGAFTLRWTYPAADGEVSITLLLRRGVHRVHGQPLPLDLGGGRLRRGHPGQAAGRTCGTQLIDGEEPAAEVDRFCDVIAAFTSPRHEGRARRRGPPAPGAAGAGGDARRGDGQRPPRRPGLLGRRRRPRRPGRPPPPPGPLRRGLGRAAAAARRRRPRLGADDAAGSPRHPARPARPPAAGGTPVDTGARRTTRPGARRA